MSIQTLVDNALSLFQGQQYQPCLDLIDQIAMQGVAVSGLYYLKAICLLHTEQYSGVLEALRRERLVQPHSPEADTLYNQLEQAVAENPLFKTPFTPHGKYLVSGIGLGGTGTSSFLQAFAPEVQSAGYTLIYPHPGQPFGIPERVRIAEIVDSDVLILHPQDLGISTFQALQKNGNRMTVYVLDNSFFCIRSYNHRPEKKGECLDCLGNLSACHASCTPFPNPYPRAQNLAFLEWLRTVAPQIRFLCQNQHQEKLLKAHFGESTNTTLVGMRAIEFDPAHCAKRYDIVFHGHALPAKGLLYFIELAKKLPEYSFLIPSSLHAAQSYSGTLTYPSNVHFEDISWSKGLQEQVMLARLVVCPSQWSAPVEVALLKSLYFNGNVAVAASEYAFEREVPPELLLRLSHDFEASAQQVRAFIHSKECKREKARAWVEQYTQAISYKNALI